jgi:hypothetical protein
MYTLIAEIQTKRGDTLYLSHTGSDLSFLMAHLHSELAVFQWTTFFVRVERQNEQDKAS